MNEPCLKDQKQLSAGLQAISWYPVLKIGAEPLLVTDPKAVTLGAKDRLSISAKDDPATCLRERQIKMWRQSSANWRKLLSDESWSIYLSQGWRCLFPGR